MSIINDFNVFLSKVDERISWDEYFSCFCLLTSARSSSEKLKVGAVIVFDNRIISTGYNGYPTGIPHVSIHRDGHEVNTIHAEQNAIIYAAKEGISIKDTTMYVTHYPCLNCCKSIIASGIKEIKYINDYNNDEIVDQLLQQTKITIKHLYVKKL
jgi:dCMP deaminase